MSLRDSRIVIAELPGRDFLENPLRTRALGPCLPAAFVAANPPCVDGEEDGLQDLVAALDNSQQMQYNSMPTGPFVLVPRTNQVKVTAIAGFKDLAGALAGKSSGVNLRWSDIIAHAADGSAASKLSSYDPTRTIPISLRVLGTSLGDAEKHCSIEVYDNTGKPMFSRFIGKTNGADVGHTMGYPLFLAKKGGHNRIMFNPPKLSDDHKNFWSFDLGVLDRNSETYRNPSTGETFRLVKRKSRAAALLDYALSVKNRIITSPRLLENEAYLSSDDPNLLRIPVKLYNDVFNAYKKKLQSVNDSSYDLSNMRVVLKPLQMSHELGLIDPSCTAGHVAIELMAHVPQKVSEDDDDADDISKYVHQTAENCGDSDDSEESESDDEL